MGTSHVRACGDGDKSCDDGVVMGTGHVTYQGFILLRASSISSLISSMWANSNHLSFSVTHKIH